MIDRIKYTIDSLPHNVIYFKDGTNVSEMLDLIIQTEKPIKIYDEGDFNNILIIDKKGNDFKFLMNTMSHTDRTKINEMSDDFINRFVEDGVWLYDIKTEKVVYNYQTKQLYGKWNPVVRNTFGHFLALDGDNKKPIKIYNNGNRMSLFWGFYYVNKYFLNPTGAVSEDFGVELAIELAQKLFNMETYTIAYHEKTKIFPKVKVWEQTFESVPEKSLKKLHKLHSDIYKEEFEEGSEKKEDEVIEMFGLTLSEEGKIHMSDLVNSSIPKLFYPVEIDLVVDPRISGAFVQEGKIIFVSAVTIEEKAKKEMKKIMGENEDNTEIRNTREVDNILSIGEQFEWYERFSPTGNPH